jgi:hypothetical protein
MREKWMRLAILPLFLMGLTSCQTRHTVELTPVEIKPIHITIDVNVRVDRALDNFFGDIDNTGKRIQGSTEGKK